MPRKKQVKNNLPDNAETFYNREAMAKTGKDQDAVLVAKHNSISKKPTSPLYVKKLMDFDYVDEGWMRQVLNDNFPVWSWEVIKYEFLGKEAVSVHGRLMIVDEGQPRYFDALAAHRMTISKQGENAGGYVDLGNDMKSANTEAFKVACNRLCNISDDVYRKSVLSEEQLDTIEGMMPLLDGQTKRKVREGIGKHTINPITFDTIMERLVNTTKIKEAE
jgi:hypothetical protein